MPITSTLENTRRSVKALALSLAPVLIPGAQPFVLRWLQQRQAGIAEDQQSWSAYFTSTLIDVQADVRAGNAEQIFEAAICYFTADKIRETVASLSYSQLEHIESIIAGATKVGVLHIMAALSGVSFPQQAIEKNRFNQAVDSLENPLVLTEFAYFLMTSLPALSKHQDGNIMWAASRFVAAFSTTTQLERDPQLVALNRQSLSEAMQLLSTPIAEAAESALKSHFHDALQQCVQWFRDKREHDSKSQSGFALLQMLITEDTVACWSATIARLIPELMTSPDFLSLFEQQASIDSLIRYQFDSGAADDDDKKNVADLLQQFEAVLMGFLSNRADSISIDLLAALDLPAEWQLTDLAPHFFTAFYPDQISYRHAAKPVIELMLDLRQSSSVQHLMQLSLMKQLQDPSSAFADRVVHKAFHKISAKVSNQPYRGDTAERQKRIFLYAVAQLDPNAAVLSDAVYDNLLQKYVSWHTSMAQQGSDQNNPFFTNIFVLLADRNIAGLQELLSDELPDALNTSIIINRAAADTSLDDVRSLADTVGILADTLLEPDWHDRIMGVLEQYKSDTTQPYAARFAMRVVKRYITPQASDHLYDLLRNHVLRPFLSSQDFLGVLKRTELSQAALSNQLNPNDETSSLEKQRAAHCYMMLHAALTHWLQNNGEQLAEKVADKTSLKRFKGYLQEMVRAELQDADSHLLQFMCQALVDHVGSISSEYRTFMQCQIGFEKSLQHMLSSKDKNAKQLMQKFDLLHEAAKNLQGIVDEQMKCDLKLAVIIDHSDDIKRKIEDGRFKKLLEIQALLVKGQKYVQRSVKQVCKKDVRMKKHHTNLQGVKDLRSNSDDSHQLAWYYKIIIIVLSLSLAERVLNWIESYIISEQEQLNSKRESLEQLDTLTADLSEAINKAIESYHHHDFETLLGRFEGFRQENSAMAAKAPLVGLFNKVGGLCADENTAPSLSSVTTAQVV